MSLQEILTAADIDHRRTRTQTQTHSHIIVSLSLSHTCAHIEIELYFQVKVYHVSVRTITVIVDLKPKPWLMLGMPPAIFLSVQAFQVHITQTPGGNTSDAHAILGFMKTPCAVVTELGRPAAFRAFRLSSIFDRPAQVLSESHLDLSNLGRTVDGSGSSPQSQSLLPGRFSSGPQSCIH